MGDTILIEASSSLSGFEIVKIAFNIAFNLRLYGAILFRKLGEKPGKIFMLFLQFIRIKAPAIFADDLFRKRAQFSKSIIRAKRAPAVDFGPNPLTPLWRSLFERSVREVGHAK